MIDYCAARNIKADVEVIRPEQIDRAYDRVVAKDVRYQVRHRYGSDLPRRLSTKDAPPGFDPSIGDIAYYAPWGNLAISYRDFGYSSGLVKLGTIDAGLDHLGVPGSLKAIIALAR